MSATPLPLELIGLIVLELADNGDTATLASLARCNSTLNELATLPLYRRLVLTRRNAARLFHGLDYKPPRPPMTKAEYEAGLAAFAERFSDLFDPENELEEEDDGDWPHSNWIDQPDTDDDLAPSADDLRAVSPSDWARRLELLAMCTHLTILQVPEEGFVAALPKAVKTDDDDKPLQLFPNVTHLAIGNRAVLTLSNYSARMIYDDPEHPLAALIDKGVLGRPHSACITCVPDEGVPGIPPNYIYHLFADTKLDKIEEDQVRFVLSEFGQHYYTTNLGRTQVAADALPDSVVSLTSHAMRYSGPRESQALRGPDHDAGIGLPFVGGTQDRTYRVFYDSAEIDSQQERADTVALALKLSAPTSDLGPCEMWEHIDVTNGVDNGTVKGIQTAVQSLLASDPAGYARRTVSFCGAAVSLVPWIEEDRDTELEAAHVAAKDEYNRLVGEVRDKENARREARKQATFAATYTVLLPGQAKELQPAKEKMVEAQLIVAQKRREANAATSAWAATKDANAKAAAQTAMDAASAALTTAQKANKALSAEYHNGLNAALLISAAQTRTDGSEDTDGKDAPG
ncbi:uncharacterized protein LOC62_07G008874 [Vanrija pseudolonga]|uniref:Uncharacterized protein n=1 Tax=Vanrija pseudolonga TaxID=143232 RepID=A0AAF0YEQ4_9TREE|nr:hypothetical protein LOC62_07G008874 [Vanrija pseudolonga]